MLTYKKISWLFKLIPEEYPQKSVTGYRLTEYESFELELSKNRLFGNKCRNEQLRVSRSQRLCKIDIENKSKIFHHMPTGPIQH